MVCPITAGRNLSIIGLTPFLSEGRVIACFIYFAKSCRIDAHTDIELTEGALISHGMTHEIVFAGTIGDFNEPSGT
jgi:hypothetical protein